LRSWHDSLNRVEGNQITGVMIALPVGMGIGPIKQD
jgi:hypothetical protein